MTVTFPPSGVSILTVGELTRGIKELLEQAHPDVWVEGEVSNLARPSSGHQYLTLKDDESPLKAVIYRGVGMRMKFDLRDGMRIVARGRLSVYAPRGEYQFLIEQVQPKGIGPLDLAFRQLKERLFERGYFDPARKKPIPRIPRRIAIVTSPTGSAVRDILEVLDRRWPAVEVWVCPVPVQGDDAARQIAAALGFLNRVGVRGGATPIDTLLLARGGGSLEDLWPFNEEVVAHAIVRSEIPVLTGIGHEDDVTIADLVADRRALTPSEAAERAVPDRAEVARKMAADLARMGVALKRQLDRARSHLEQLAARPCLRRPVDRLREEERRLDETAERLERGLSRRLDQSRHRLDALAGRLAGLSPLGVLSRGYSLTRRLDDLGVVRSVGQVEPGDWIITQVAKGRIVSRVESIAPDPSQEETP
jgi:exodeoxyribonuclease VII large subunit